MTAEEQARRTAAILGRAAGREQPLPEWLRRQRRPSSASFVPLGDTARVENVSGRSWTAIGTVAAGVLGVVDRAGAVSPARGGWSLEWAVRGGDRWYVAAAETTVRQHAIDGAAVIETALRIPGGDAVSRAFAVAAEHGDAIVVEIENPTAEPVAVALAVRPFDPLGAGVVDAIEVDGAALLVNEQVAVVLPRPPARAVAGDGDSEDSFVAAMQEGAPVPGSLRASCARGVANATVVVPLPHRATLRVLVVPGGPRAATRRPPVRVPDYRSVTRGWQAHLDAATVLDVADEPFVPAWRDAVRRLLLEGAGVGAPLGARDWTVSVETAIVGGMMAAGLADVAAPILRDGVDDQRPGTWLRRVDNTTSDTLSVLQVVVDHWCLTGDREVARDVFPPAARAAASLGRRVRRGGHDAALARFGPLTRSLARLATELGEHAAAADLDAYAGGARAPEDDPPDTDELAVATARGIDVRATLDRARHELVQGDRRGLDRLRAALALRSPTGAWPTFVHPRTGRGTGGSGDDPAAAAELVLALRSLLVRDGGEGLELLPVFPDEWRGSSLDVRRLPTNKGILSFSVRWHGTRPALLWQLDQRRGSPRLAAPGLSPEWTSDAADGEELLPEFVVCT